MSIVAAACGLQRNAVSRSRYPTLTAVLLAFGAVASFASAAPAADNAQTPSRPPSAAVQKRISQLNLGLADFRAATTLLVAELDAVPAHAPRSDASRVCYDQALPAVDPIMDDVQATKQFFNTGHQCTVDSDDACWMPVFDRFDAKLADVMSRLGKLQVSLEACRKLGT